jgi:hypothetical protein
VLKGRGVNRRGHRGAALGAISILGLTLLATDYLSATDPVSLWLLLSLPLARYLGSLPDDIERRLKAYTRRPELPDGVRQRVKGYTKHRGPLHSLVTAVVAGVITAVILASLQYSALITISGHLTTDGGTGSQGVQSISVPIINGEVVHQVTIGLFRIEILGLVNGVALAGGMLVGLFWAIHIAVDVLSEGGNTKIEVLSPLTDWMVAQGWYKNENRALQEVTFRVGRLLAKLYAAVWVINLTAQPVFWRTVERILRLGTRSVPL